MSCATSGSTVHSVTCRLRPARMPGTPPVRTRPRAVPRLPAPRIATRTLLTRADSSTADRMLYFAGHVASPRHVGAGHRARSALPAGDHVEDLLRLPDPLRRAPQHQRLSDLPRDAGGAAGPQPSGGGVRAPRRPRARVRHPAGVDLRAQELLLSGSSEG